MFGAFGSIPSYNFARRMDKNYKFNVEFLIHTFQLLITNDRLLPIKFVSGDDLFRLFVKIACICTIITNFRSLYNIMKAGNQLGELVKPTLTDYCTNFLFCMAILCVNYIVVSCVCVCVQFLKKIIISGRHYARAEPLLLTPREKGSGKLCTSCMVPAIIY